MLNAESWSIGQLVKAGHIDGSLVAQELEMAGLACGLPLEEIRRTVPRAIDQSEARQVHLEPMRGTTTPDVSFTPQAPPAPAINQPAAPQTTSGPTGGAMGEGQSEAELQAHAAQWRKERDIAVEVEKLEVREEAQRRFNRRHLDGLIEQITPPTDLADFLSVEDPPVQWVLEDLQPVGTRALLAAQAKSGKTTMVANLIQALADGDRFLGEFFNHFDGTITLIDDELDDRMLRRWLKNINIRHPEKIRVVTLRGRLTDFNIVDEDVREVWAGMLTGTDYLILDCLRPVLDACGLDENHEAGIFLNAFDALLKQADIDNALVVHHMGHSANRSRGDSRIMDWPDALWKLTRTDPEDPASKRFFTAFGREVNITQQPLHYTDGHLVLNDGDGSVREPYAITPAPWIAQVLYLEGEPRSKAWIEAHAAEKRETNDHIPKRQAIREAIKAMEQDRALTKITVDGQPRLALNPDHPDCVRLTVSN